MNDETVGGRPPLVNGPAARNNRPPHTQRQSAARTGTESATNSPVSRW